MSWMLWWQVTTWMILGTILLLLIIGALKRDKK